MSLDPDMVTPLLELFVGRGADVNAPNASGETPLFKVSFSQLPWPHTF